MGRENPSEGGSRTHLGMAVQVRGDTLVRDNRASNFLGPPQRSTEASVYREPGGLSLTSNSLGVDRTLASRNSSTPAYSRALCAAKSTKVLPREPPDKESYRCYPTKN